MYGSENTATVEKMFSLWLRPAGASLICEFCGAVLSHVAAIGDDVTAVVCLTCGGQNGPASRDCIGCGQTLSHSCPRCGASVQIDAVSCPACEFERGDFYDECVRKELARAESQARKLRRATFIDDAVGVGFVTIFALTGWWQGFRSDASAWKFWLFLTLMYLMMWILSKSGR